MSYFSFDPQIVSFKNSSIRESLKHGFVLNDENRFSALGQRIVSPIILLPDGNYSLQCYYYN